MKPILLFLIVISACSAALAEDRHVVIITLDGFPAYLFHDPRAPIPTLRKLAAEGVSAEGMRVSNPSITWPNHTTLVTGVTPIWPRRGVIGCPSPGMTSYRSAAACEHR